MTTRPQIRIVVMAFAIGLAGCDGSRATAPTAPTAPTRPTATLSGTVFAATPSGLEPVEGARVRLEIGSYRQDALTDRQGSYRMTDLYEGNSAVTTTGSGYDTDTRQVAISGDVRLDIRIEPRVMHTLSGVVYEMTPTGRSPIEGVELYCDSCGSPTGHTWAYTDVNGFYSLAWTPNGVHPLFVTKEGYETTGLVRDGLGRVSATVRGDTRFDIQLARR